MASCPYCACDVTPSKHAWDETVVQGCSRCLNPIVARSDGAVISIEPLPNMRDIRALAPVGSVIGNILGQLNEVLDVLPVLPEVPQRILTMVHDPLTSMGDLAEVMTGDAVISMKILKLANSAYMANVQEIKALDSACARLGIKVIANAVCVIAQENLYRSPNPKFRRMMKAQWRHSLAVAHCADELGVRVYGGDDSTAFEAGLMHDIGMTVLLDLITTKYKGSVGRLREAPDLMVKVLEKYHTLVGLHVVQHWDLEPQFHFSTLYHHNPDMVIDEGHKPLTDIVALANDMAHEMGYGFSPGLHMKIAEHPSAGRLGYVPEELASLKVSMSARIESLLESLSMI